MRSTSPVEPADQQQPVRIADRHREQVRDGVVDDALGLLVEQLDAAGRLDGQLR
ncbi:MAG: hypothetical protein WKF78_00370 [Candidatus Limnocylindrales bacterium]